MTATAPAPSPLRPPSTVPLALRHAVLVLLGTVLALFVGAAPASAHAVITASDPGDGAVVATAPTQVTLTFSEGVALDADSIRVMDPGGSRVDTGELVNLCDGNVIRYGTPLRDGLANGTYTVAWQAVSADSHPVSGAFIFSVGAPSATSVDLPEQTAGGGPVGVAYDIARYAAYAGFILLTGAAAFVLLCWQRGAGLRAVQKLVVVGWVTLTAATLGMLALRHPYTTSGNFSDAFDLSGLKAVLDTKSGAALSSRLLLLGAAALFIAVLFGAYARRVAALGTPGQQEADGSAEEDPTARSELRELRLGLGVGGAIVAGGIAATWALSEHASTGVQPQLAMPLDIAHLLAVATWFGGLVTLLVALRQVPDLERSAVRAFSRIAFGCVCVLVATGLYQAWRQVGSWSALTGTGYGQLFLVKAGLVVVLVAVASGSRRWTGRLAELDLQVVAVDATDREPVPAGSSSAGGHTGPGVDLAPGSPTEPGAEPEAGREVDPARAAQLARQQAARENARERQRRDADPGRSALRRSVLTEVAIASVLLGVATLLTGTEPGRAAEQEASRAGSAAPAVPDRPVKFTLPFDTGGEDGRGTARIELDPGRTGGNTLHLWLERTNGKPLDAPEVKVSFTLPAKDIGPLSAEPDHAGTGHWLAGGIQLPLAGEWRIDLTVRTSDIDQTTVNKTVKIG
ncbi:copper resistance CopC/CopD family protein [Streptomyces sp. NPDC006879]|uniref:copper resistance CopC/CopD family protein n=1 Tax=Streptomyces sp. NPDC006879 TaxID=3364767 RepID=UPI00368FACA2